MPLRGGWNVEGCCVEGCREGCDVEGVPQVCGQVAVGKSSQFPTTVWYLE